ncbi:MAG: ATP-binding cassette domain-containing protein, partial [Salinisphaeraceae bacterium]|nr:ATP-binding cassette domain-containing protein [Salinisphaeraceae bacterium]
GAGKSTLLKALSGDVHFSGDAHLHGKPIQHWPRRESARHMAVLPQHSSVGFALSAYEVATLGLTPLSVSRLQARTLVMEHMQAWHCWHLAPRPITSLSGGERQRVHLARVCLQLSQAKRPPLLLLDEPTSAQDLHQQHKILATMRQLCHQQRFTVLAVLHDLNHALAYADRCLVIKQGEIVLDGPPQQSLMPSTVNDIWDYLPATYHHANSQRALLF